MNFRNTYTVVYYTRQKVAMSVMHCAPCTHIINTTSQGLIVDLIILCIGPLPVFVVWWKSRNQNLAAIIIVHKNIIPTYAQLKITQCHSI